MLLQKLVFSLHPSQMSDLEAHHQTPIWRPLSIEPLIINILTLWSDILHKHGLKVYNITPLRVMWRFCHRGSVKMKTLFRSCCEMMQLVMWVWFCVDCVWFTWGAAKHLCKGVQSVFYSVNYELWRIMTRHYIVCVDVMLQTAEKIKENLKVYAAMSIMNCAVPLSLFSPVKMCQPSSKWIKPGNNFQLVIEYCDVLQHDSTAQSTIL